jgi:hypothetical protein
MRASFVFFAAALLVGLGAPERSHSQTIEDPPLFEWTQQSSGADVWWTGTLEYGEATFTIGGETLTTRAIDRKAKASPFPVPRL